MKVLVLGATGFIGRYLVEKLLDRGHDIYILTRNEDKARSIFNSRVHIKEWDASDISILGEYLRNVEVVINMAGENLAAKRWSKKQKDKILSSRINMGKALSDALNESDGKQYLLIQASAVGFYGFSDNEVFTEDSPNGDGFLPSVTQRWEDSVKNVDAENTRVVFIRSGVVLGREGGILPTILVSFRNFIGGPLGNGRQWLSWIHIDDETEAIVKLMETEGVSGPYNLTAPNPVTMNEFTRTLGKVMNRPSWLSVPGFLLKAIFGDMARETMLQGQKALPKRLQETGFEFQHPSLEEALKDLLKR